MKLRKTSYIAAVALMLMTVGCFAPIASAQQGNNGIPSQGVAIDQQARRYFI